MDSPKLTVLDVGHGNSAVLHDSKGLVIFDAGPGATLDEYLQSCKVEIVTALLVSHSDADHLAGASNVLLSEDFHIEAVYLNPDADQGSVAFETFRRALASSIQRSGTVVHTQLTKTTGTSITAGDVTIAILAPSPNLATAGPGGTDLKGRRIRPNTMSAVAHLSVGERPVVLLAGDIDQVALEHLLEENKSIQADTLVFPHHGGRPGSADPKTFTTTLVNAVKPGLILFSTGRGKKNINPIPSVIEAILEVDPSIHIACTQLSMQCSASTPTPGTHLSTLTAAGKEGGKCCIGTVEISFSKEKETFPILAEHRTFVTERVETALCILPAKASGHGIN
jgi:beta-lactamase superfamily II metal-dependent hydrolase